MKWIRFESRLRYHAVYGELPGGTLLTYCGRTRRSDAFTDATEAPRARCACCKSRIRNPFLIPERWRPFRAPVAAEGAHG